MKKMSLKYKTQLLMVCVLTVSLNTHAATKKRKSDLSAPETQMIDLAVPQSQLDLDHYELAPTPSTYVVELTGSTWFPTSTTFDSNLADTSDFSGSSSVPQVSINALTTGWLLGQVKLTPKYGISFEQMQRHGEMQTAGISFQRSQNLSLYSARVGAELTSERIHGRLQPYVGAALLPSMFQITKSEMSDGLSRNELGLEGTAGVVLQLPQFAKQLGATNIGLELGLQATHGLIGSDLNGAGILAGTRVEL